MAEEEKQTPPEPPLPSPTESAPHPTDQPPETSTPPAKFDPSRIKLVDIPELFSAIVNLIGIIKRKALVKDLASTYHTECLAYCRELLDLQKREDEPLWDIKARKI